MPTVRQNLLKWFPVLASLHRRYHSIREKGIHLYSKIKQGFEHVRFNLLWEARIHWAARESNKTKLTKPIIHLYAICWNEERIIPYFMKYYQQFVDEFFIYDNMSTDSTLALLAKYKNVTIIPYDTGDTVNDSVYLKIKNNAWKQSRGKADFVIVSDMDEFLHHPHMHTLLHLLHKHAYTIAKPHGYNMVSNVLPEFADNKNITQLIRNGVDAKKNYSKTLLFSPNLDEINFTSGCHKSFPKGLVKRFSSDHLKLLHYKYIDRDLILLKTKQHCSRLSEINKLHGWGSHYIKTDDQILAEFDHLLSMGREVI